MRRTTLTLVAAALLAIGAAGTVQAAAPTQPIATPAAACRALIDVGAGGYASFQDCMAQINADVRDYRFSANPEDPASAPISLSDNCRMLEEGFRDPVTGEMLFQVTYPFFFDEPPPWPFPLFTGMNHRQCQFAIFAYHKFVGL